MSEPIQATPEAWAQIEGYASTDLHDDYAICLVALRNRVQALEEAENDRRFRECQQVINNAKPTSNQLPIRSSADHPLLMRVARAIHPSICADPHLYVEEARRAIQEMAAWLRDTHGWTVAPALLESAAAEDSQEGDA